MPLRLRVERLPPADGKSVAHPFAEYLHPRDAHGRFALAQSLAKRIPTIPSTGSADGKGTADEPIEVGDDLARAAELLAEGKHVRLSQPDQVATLLTQLRRVVEDARAKGDKAPTYDLCKVSVRGINLFCQQSKGIPRAKMPQFRGEIVPGSPAEATRTPKGRGNIEQLFRDTLAAIGLPIEQKTVLASHLRASQNELDGVKVAEMAAAMEAGLIPEAPIFVTRDGYVIDGHHRWAAKVALETAATPSGRGRVQMPVEIVDMDIGSAIDYANAFARAMGIKQKSHGDPSPALVAAVKSAALAVIGKEERQVVDHEVKKIGRGKFEEARHPRGKDGRFIHIGDHVDLGGGVTGEVTGTGKGGQLSVRRSDTGRVTHVDSRKVSAIPRSRTAAVSANNPSESPVGPRMAPNGGAGPAAPGNAAPGTAGADLSGAINAVHSGQPQPATLTPEEYQAHTQRIEAAIKEAMAAGQTSDKLYTLDGQGQVYTPERAAQHKAILDELWTKADSVPSDGKAVIAGGLGGAGKSTVLGKFAKIPQDQYLTINPDDVKEAMAARGMMPQIEGLSPMETSALVHEESSHLANMLAKRAYGARKNVVWDITMSSRGSVEKRIAEMRSAGYQDIQGVFVDIPVETSVSRALARHQRGMEQFKQGQGDGGRYVPPALIRANNDSEFSSANRRVFETLRDQFDSWQAWDNSVNGREPIRTAQSANLPLDAPAARGHQTASQKVGNNQVADLQKLADDLGLSLRVSRGVRSSTVTLGGTASQLAEFRRRSSGPSIDWPTVEQSPVGQR